MVSMRRACARSGWVAFAALTAACEYFPSTGPGSTPAGTSGSAAASSEPSAECHREEITIPPPWECSAAVFAQLAEDRRLLSRSGDDVVDALRSSLVAYDSCASGVESTREALSVEVDRRLRGARINALSWGCEPRFTSRMVGDCSAPPRDAAPSAFEGVFSNVDSAASPAAPGSPPASTGASESSTTNTQVAGVDEADFVKNDSEFVYTIAERIPAPSSSVSGQAAPASTAPVGAAPGELVILDVWPAEQAHEVSRIALDGFPKKLYLDGDLLLVYASAPPDPNQVRAYDPWGNRYYGSGVECSYGYRCVPTGDSLATLVTVYDVADRAAPRQLRQLVLSGSYLNSRRVGDVVYTVVQDEVRLLPGMQLYPTPSPVGPDATLAAFAELAAQNQARIAQASPEELLPSIGIRTASGDLAAQPIDCGRIFEAPGRAGRGFLSVVSLSLTDDAALPQRVTLVSEPGFTYASEGSLYVAVPQRPAYDPQRGALIDTSLIHEFSLAGLATDYVASGRVQGHVLNQFSMDEYQDHLRVATTTGYAGNGIARSALSVLAPRDAELVTVGKIDDIAPGEDIRSARFVGDRGYVVTFEKTDPLYVFDLAEPESPRIAGELEIPGFSTYIHPLDRDHLLSIGYDAEDQGNVSWFRGIQLQVFDVADMSNPTLLHKTLIGTRGSSSDALDNHLAFNYFAPKRWLALPITVCQGGEGADYGQLEFSGLYLYDVSLESGFQLLGGVDHAPTQAGAVSSAVSCANWWSNARSFVKRSVILDDYVLSITDNELKLNHSADLQRDVAVLPLSR